jgi:hypothetical protein
MVKILREADKAPVAKVAKKHGISEATIYACASNSAAGFLRMSTWGSTIATPKHSACN